MGTNISYEIKLHCHMGHGFGTVEYVTTATKDYGYAECEYLLLLNCTVSSEKSERPERSVHRILI
jgi:hypothetical protein